MGQVIFLKAAVRGVWRRKTTMKQGSTGGRVDQKKKCKKMNLERTIRLYLRSTKALDFAFQIKDLGLCLTPKAHTLSSDSHQSFAMIRLRT
jgi:hypothetical protein